MFIMLAVRECNDSPVSMEPYLNAWMTINSLKFVAILKFNILSVYWVENYYCYYNNIHLFVIVIFCFVFRANKSHNCIGTIY